MIDIYVGAVFDTFMGLPVHALVVHAVVILLPLMSVLTPLVAVLPKWRAVGALPVLVADVVVLILTFVAKESGEKLEGRLEQLQAQGATPEWEEHAEAGDLLPLFALALVIAAVVLYLAVRKGGPLVPVAMGLTVVAGIAALSWAAYVGHLGAEAVWKDQVTQTHAPAGD